MRACAYAKLVLLAFPGLLYHSAEGAWQDGNPFAVRTNFGTADLPSSPLLLEQASARTCFHACKANPKCAAWTFVHAGCSAVLEELPKWKLSRNARATAEPTDKSGAGKAPQVQVRRALRQTTPRINSTGITLGAEGASGGDDKKLAQGEEPLPAVCWLKAAVPPQEAVSEEHQQCKWASGVMAAARKGLAPLQYKPLPLSTVQPTGWLEKQLRLQVHGLSGHLDLFWLDVMDSTWVGGQHDNSGAGHERGPYWLNGVIPLAALLNATGVPYNDGEVDLNAQVNYWVEYILTHQNSNGWLGPDDGWGGQGNTYWTGWNTAIALLQYAEASAAQGDSIMAQRCNYAVFRYVNETYARMLTTPMQSWSQNRWQDYVYIVHVLMDQAPQGHEQLLWDAAALAQQQQFDWNAYYSEPRAFADSLLTETAFNFTRSKHIVEEPYRIPSGPAPGWTMWDHGVNNAMATKGGAVWYRQSHNQADLDQSYRRLALQDKFHGQPYGMFGADECFSGRNLNRGIELCAVVEQMYSLQHMFRVQGDPLFLDRCERITYNALPATITPDMWAHQYLQQANEISAGHTDPPVWVSDGPDSTLFGVEPNFGCCTANFNQGWPKLATNLFFETPKDGGIGIGVFAPGRAVFPAGTTVPQGVTVEMITEYPFGDTVVIVVTVPCTELGSQGNIPLHVRIPGWAKHAAIDITHTDTAEGPTANASAFQPKLRAGNMHIVQCSVGRTTVTLHLNPQLEVELGWGDSAVQKAHMDADGYLQAVGALSAGNDIHVGNYTLSEAKALCNTTEKCNGFTLMEPVSTLQPETKYLIYFKSSRAMNSDVKWTSMLKVWADVKTNAATVVRGPLMFALPLQETLTTVRTWEPFKNQDFDLSTTDQWNVALVLDPHHPSTTLQYTQLNRSSDCFPFDTLNYHAVIRADVQVLPRWHTDPTSARTAGEPPPSPVTCTDDTHGPSTITPKCGATQTVLLVPYGATNIRMGALPWIQSSATAAERQSSSYE